MTTLLSLLAGPGAAVRGGAVTAPLRSLTLAHTVDAAPVLRSVTTASLAAADLLTGGQRITLPDARVRLLGYDGTTDLGRVEAHSWEWVYTGAQICLRLAASSQPAAERAIRVYVDGAPVTSGMVVGVASTQYLIDLGSVASRTIRVDLSRVALQAIDTSPGASISATPPRTKLYMLGDSWVAGASYVPDEAGLRNGPGIEHMAFLAGRLLDASMVIGGNGGTGYSARAEEGVHYAAADRMARVVAHAPDYLVVFGSINDDNSAASTAGEYATHLYQHIEGSVPACKIIVIGVQDYGQQGTSNPRVASAALAASNVIAYRQPLSEDWVSSGDSTINNSYNPAHLTVYGNRVYAELLRDAVLTAVADHTP